jgi:hypothetical protein
MRLQVKNDSTFLFEVACFVTGKSGLAGDQSSNASRQGMLCLTRWRPVTRVRMLHAGARRIERDLEGRAADV